MRAWDLVAGCLVDCYGVALAYLGYLLGSMNREATPTLAPVPGVDLEDYKQTLIERLANPQIRDTITRLGAERDCKRRAARDMPSLRPE